MKQNSFATRPPLLLESSLTTYNTKAQRRGKGTIKFMSPPTPPDAATIRKLNALAAKHPFCGLHKVKKHDTL